MGVLLANPGRGSPITGEARSVIQELSTCKQYNRR